MSNFLIVFRPILFIFILFALIACQSNQSGLAQDPNNPSTYKTSVAVHKDGAFIIQSPLNQLSHHPIRFAYLQANKSKKGTIKIFLQLDWETTTKTARPLVQIHHHRLSVLSSTHFSKLKGYPAGHFWTVAYLITWPFLEKNANQAWTVQVSTPTSQAHGHQKPTTFVFSANDIRAFYAAVHDHLFLSSNGNISS